MRARFAVGALAGLATAAGVWACIPEPTQDFDDYQTRAHAFQGAGGDAGPTVEAGPPPTTAQTGLYAATCLTELASGQVSLAFVFYTETSFTPAASGGGGTLSLSLKAMATVNNKPPTTFSSAGTVGTPFQIQGPTDASGSFSFTVASGVTVNFPGSSNPITPGADVVLSNAGLAGKFAADHFCGRLIGHVDQPAAASRTLDENKNFCIFDATKDGDPVPKHVFADFSVANCPL